MSTYQLLCGALLLSAPFASRAQSTNPVPSYRFYGGLALYSGHAQTLYFHSDQFNAPVQATLGYQLRPRLAVQVGLAYSGNKSNDAYNYSYTDTNANLVSYANTTSYSQRTYTTSVLARYTLTRQAAHRFQVDVLVGPSLAHSTNHFVGTETYTRQGTTDVVPYNYSSSYNNLLVNLGPSFRYRFGSRFEAVYDVLFNVSLTNSYHSANTAMALGARYCFGH